MDATFQKYNGQWAVRVEGPHAPAAGETIMVRKRSGASNAVTVAAVLRSHGSVHLCSIASEPRKPRTPRAPSKEARRSAFVASAKQDAWDRAMGPASGRIRGVW